MHDVAECVTRNYTCTQFPLHNKVQFIMVSDKTCCLFVVFWVFLCVCVCVCVGGVGGGGEGGGVCFCFVLSFVFSKQMCFIYI